MSAAPIASLQAWQEFYEVIGAAAAALLGAMFVVASIGSGFLTQDRAGEVRLFPDAHRGATFDRVVRVRVGAGTSLGWRPLGVLFGPGNGRLHLLHYDRNEYWRRELVLSDRLWYAGAPIVATR